MKRKDMSEREFRAALTRNGMREFGLMGYVDIGNGVSVSMLNANTTNLRAILAYLLNRQAHYQQEAEARQASR
jgi:hypothetical protein